MNTPAISNTNDVFDLCRGLPEWINRHGRAEGSRSCRAREMDNSFNGLPTLTVDMSGAAGLVASYKCNISLVRGEQRAWLVFSPLVVVWAMDRRERGPGFGRRIIEHSVASIAGFCRAHVSHIPDVLVASGNLTTAKGGRPFFAGLGWEIVEPQSRGAPSAEDGLDRALAHIEAQIDAALAPLRQSAPGSIEPTSFALLRAPVEPVIQRVGPSAGWCATIPAR